MILARLIFRHFTNHLLWLVRMTAAGLVLRGDKRRAVTELRKNGFARLSGYVSEHDLAYLDEACRKALDDAASKDYPGARIAKPGAIRLKHLHEVYFPFNYFRRNLYFMFVNFCMSGRIAWPSVMLSLTHDGLFEHPAVPGKSTFAFAHDWHVDRIEHQLKVQIYLEDIAVPENGPTMVCPGSQSDWRKIRFQYEQDGTNAKYGDGENLPEGLQRVSPEQIRAVEAEYGVQPLLAKRGDVCFFDSSAIHCAGNLTQGMRKILWFYY